LFLFSNSFRHGLPDAFASAVANPNADAIRESDAVRQSNSDCKCDAEPKSDADPERDPDPQRHSEWLTDIDRNANTDRVTVTNSQRHSVVEPDSDIERHCYSIADPDPDG
jgi:hypothetical protein